MIIIDFSQLAIAHIIGQIESSLDAKGEFNEDIARHTIINAIRLYSLKFRSAYGREIIFACDSDSYWRRDIFPHYKFHRKKNREVSKYDWNLIYEKLNLVKNELKDNSPFKILEISNCEADDIIAVLTKRYAPHQKVVICSRDKDFAQLQANKNVSQYNMIKKTFIKVDNPSAALKELIIRGDKDDGIPNIMSPDDVFASGGRQGSIMTVKLNEWLVQEPEQFCNDSMLRNYYRNKKLIDFSDIPSDVAKAIINGYEEYVVKSKQQFLDYMISKRMKLLIPCIGDF